MIEDKELKYSIKEHEGVLKETYQTIKKELYSILNEIDKYLDDKEKISKTF